MSRTDFASELAERLRRGGADFKPADLTAFASGVPPSEGDSNIEALADLFVEASRIYAAEITRRNHAGRVLTVGVLVLASGVVGIVLAALGMVAVTDAPSPHPDALVLLIAGAASLILAIIGLAATVYGTSCLGWADTRLRMLLRETANRSNSTHPSRRIRMDD